MESINFISKRKLKGLVVFVATFCLAALVSPAARAEQPLDRSLAPQGEEPISNVFRDMGVVQRKAMVKDNRFLLSNFGSLDFSDGPYSIYGFNVNAGYAISDFWEIYVNFVPFFISNPRSIVDKIKQLQLAGGEQAFIDFAKPKLQYGIELLWAPAYGKDSLGSKRVVRSDTFFKVAAAQIQYKDETHNKTVNGWKFQAGIGKTYFLARYAGFRIAATANYIQTYQGVGSAELQKLFGFFAIVEAGFVIYI